MIVVDDDPVIRALLSDCLEASGFKVTSFSNGQECLASLSQGCCQTIFLDLQMPNMNGIEVLKQIRARPELNKLRVVMLSANVDNFVITIQEGVNADGFLAKPFKMHELLAMV